MSDFPVEYLSFAIGKAIDSVAIRNQGLTVMTYMSRLILREGVYSAHGGSIAYTYVMMLMEATFASQGVKSS